MALPRWKREANDRWDKANMSVMGVKVRKDYAERFKAACKAAGTNPNAVFKKAADDFLAAHPLPEQPSE